MNRPPIPAAELTKFFHIEDDSLWVEIIARTAADWPQGDCGLAAPTKVASIES